MSFNMGGGDGSSELGLSDAAWLAQLPAHPVFQAGDELSMAASAAGRPSAMAVRNSDVLVAVGPSLRMTSLLEAKHRTTTSTASDQGPASVHGALSTSYKRLVAAALDFDIVRLIVNPTGKLVVAVGTHKLAVVVLPRPGALAAAGTTFPSSSSSRVRTHAGDVGVKAALVGPFYHHDRIGGKGRLADVKWHPWGELGSSLLVVTRDGILREYNVASDVEEPAQTVSLLPSPDAQQSRSATPRPGHLSSFRARSRSRSRSRPVTPAARRAQRSTSRVAFDYDDDDSWDEQLDEGDESFYTANGSVRSCAGPSHTAVAFTLGIDDRVTDDVRTYDSTVADWMPLTLFTLCSNGDVFSLCPFMPSKGSIPSDYLHSLSSYVTLAVSEYGNEASSLTAPSRDLEARFVSILLKQARLHHENTRARSETPADMSMAARRALSATPMSVDEIRASVEPEQAPLNESVSVSAPSTALLPRQPTPQGPYLLAPSPQELSDEVESIASDIFFARVSAYQDGLNIIGIASTNGKVDMCLTVEPVLPAWSRQEVQKARTPPKSGRYALSDSEDEVDDTDEQSFAHRSIEAELPTLLVYESVDLGLLGAINGDGATLEHKLQSAPMRFVLDPLYSDIVYVQHIAGAHVLGFGSWTHEILSSMSASSGPTTNPDDSTASVPADPTSALVRALHRGICTDLVWAVKTVPEGGLGARDSANPVCGLCIVSDIYLCYSFLSLTRTGTLVAFELTLRVDDGEAGADAKAQDANGGATGLGEDASAPAAYTSLLGDGPAFVPPEPFKTFRGLPAQPLNASQKASDVSAKELRVTPESLRALAATVQGLRSQMRSIVQGGNAVQSRLELQMEELKRQLGKLEDASRRIDARSTDDHSSTGRTLASRLSRALGKQEELGRRSDRLLQRLIENHSPELSIYEMRWLLELERLQEQIGHVDSGAAAAVTDRQITIKGTRAAPKTSCAPHVDGASREGSDVSGLVARMEALRYRLDILKPELERSLNQRQQKAGQDVRPRGSLPGQQSGSVLGMRQLHDIEAMLASESKLLATDRDKILHLNAAVRKQIRGLSHMA